DQSDGVDFSARYNLPTLIGRFMFMADVVYLRAYDRTLADGTVIHGQGTWDLNSSGTGGTYPAFKFNAGILWGLKGFGAGVNARFIGSFKECGDSGGIMDGGGLCYDKSHIGERT